MELTFENILYDDCLEKPRGYSAKSKKISYPGTEELENWLKKNNLNNKFEIRYSNNGKYAFSNVSDETDHIIAISKGKVFEAYIVKCENRHKKQWYLTPDEKKKSTCIKENSPEELNKKIISAIVKKWSVTNERTEMFL
ncbi:MAG: hypothetical protein J6B01_12660 [Ruminococcus sp.]|nr:hypothetical protein [Ruminococcus sp.]